MVLQHAPLCVVVASGRMTARDVTLCQSQMETTVEYLAKGDLCTQRTLVDWIFSL
jgi:hypothetical protein